MATTPSTTSSELAHDLRETLGRLVRRLRAEPGAPPVGRLAVLGRLEREGSATISALAASEHMRPQSMAQTVHDLEKAALVSRRSDPADGRKSLVELTDEGVELLRATRARRETWFAAALESELDDDERAVVREALALLERVAEA